MSIVDVFRKAVEELEKGFTIALITIIDKEGSGPRDIGSTILYSQSGLKIGTIGGGDFEKMVIEEAVKAISEGKSRRVKYALRPENIPSNAVKTSHLCGGVVEIFINVVKPNPRIVIFGAGNIGKPLADLASFLNYKVVVLDTDQGLVSRDKFPYADEIYAGDLIEYIDKNVFKENDIVIIAYGEVETDYQILRKLLLKNYPGHIWVICSRRRCSWMLKRIIDEGIELNRFIEKIHMPAGLNINSDTPEEIAISIFAEIICVLKKCEEPVKSLNLVKKLWESISKNV